MAYAHNAANEYTSIGGTNVYYDAVGRRIEKIEYASPANITTRYYYDGWGVLAETDAADTLQREYVYGNYLV